MQFGETFRMLVTNVFEKNLFQQLEWQQTQVLKALYSLCKQEYSTPIHVCYSHQKSKVHQKSLREACVTFHRRWNWIIAINGPNTRIESTRPPCCFNNQHPDILCTLKYIMYDTLKCTHKHYIPSFFSITTMILGKC